jgi:outer membrane immunogenic protein
MNGFLGGAQIGYNQQIGQFVAGLEADFDAFGMRGNANYAVGPIMIPIGLDPPLSTEQSNRLLWLGTVRPRLGWLMTPSTLIYGTGGLAYGEVKISSTVLVGPPGGPCPGSEFCAFGSNSDTRTGWTAGGGIETVLGPHWTAKIEYLYFDLGSVSDALISQSPLALGGHEIIATSVKVNGNIMRAGLNYKFN